MSEMQIEREELRDALRQMHAALGEAPTRDAAWGAVRDAGWLGLTVPEAQGGLEQSLVAACWMYAELGRALSPAPVAPALLAVEALKACDASAERDSWLERIVGGDVPAVSLLDPAAAVLDIGDRIGGTIRAVENAAGASHVLVPANDVVALVPLSHSGVKVIAHATWDRSRELADVVLGNVLLADVTVLARGASAKAATRALAIHLHFAIAADCVGAADALLEQTVAYLGERRQFDRPLAMFQALKHRCADLKVAIASAEALLDDNLAALHGEADPMRLAKAAKAFASQAFRLMAEESVQLHGGMGMTAEHPCHWSLKRALLNEHLASPDDACELAAAADLMAESH